MQQFRADSGTGIVTAAMAVAGCSMQFVLPNRTPLPATREAGLVQIYSAVSTVLRVRRSAVTGLPIGSSVDTAIWTKPCGDLAGQLL